MKVRILTFILLIIILVLFVISATAQRPIKANVVKVEGNQVTVRKGYMFFKCDSLVGYKVGDRITMCFRKDTDTCKQNYFKRVKR